LEESSVRALIDLLKGFRGHPSHPPLTDASIGAYTVGTAMLVAGALGLEKTQMAHGGLLAISGGLVLAAPTALTGLLDWLDIPRGTPARTTATLHLCAMVSATLLFALAWLLQRPGYVDGDVRAGGWIVSVVAELVLAVGGYLGGTIVFVYAHRVVGETTLPVGEALKPSAHRGSIQNSPDGRSVRAPASPRS
jgi:uncharacterized membrane protein